ncbi:MAG: bifunctional riboflavin kinase/FAD synthetase [Bacteroides sp.]
MQIIRNIPPAPPPPNVATIGFFDGVHQGHRFLIEQVKEIAKGRRLHSALITFPVHPRKVMNAQFHPDLLTSPTEKSTLLAETEVDYCLMLDFTPDISLLTAKAFMTDILQKRYGVQCLVIGYDHRFGHNRSEGFDDYCRYGQAIGMEVICARACMDDELHFSSSAIRDLLHRGEVESAARCLGYDYFLNGRVVGGCRVGRTIGFPTANLCVDDPDKLIPANGVYAVRVAVNGQTYKGMLNIGHRPTLDNGAKSIEVNILHFHSDIYDQSIRLSFVHYLRPEQKFDTLDLLVAQMRKDEELVEAFMQ